MNATLEAPAISSVTPEGTGELLCDLVEDGVSYTLVLPNADEDYLQKRIATERSPYEIEMLRDMRDRLQPGDLVLDVGANVGNHTMYLAAAARCRVMAFEPNTSLCSALLRSVELNGMHDRVQIRAVAVGNKAGRGRFETCRPTNLGAQRVNVGEGSLPVIKLDDLSFEGPVRALKIDVEGMETVVLDGARELLARDHPLVYVECQTAQEYRQVADQLAVFGYGFLESFNATPTHLFVSEATIGSDVRLSRMQRKAVEDSYRNQQVVEALRARVDSLSSRLNEAFERHAVLKEKLAVEHAGRMAETQRATQAAEDLAHAKTQIDALEASAGESTLRFSAQAQALSQAQQEVSHHTLQLQALGERLARAEKQRDQLQARWDAEHERLEKSRSEEEEANALRDVERQELLRRAVEWQALADARDTVAAQLSAERDGWRQRFDALHASTQSTEQERREELRLRLELEATNQRLVAELQTLQETCDTLRAEQEARTADDARLIDDLRQGQAAARRQAEEAGINVAQLQTEIDRERCARLALAERQVELEAQLGRVSAACAQATEGRHAVERQLEQMRSEAANSRLALVERQVVLEAQLERASAAGSEARAACTQATQARAVLETRLEQTRGEYRAMKERAAQRGNECDQLKSRLSRLEQERQDARHRVAETQAIVTSLTQEQRAVQAMMREVFQVHDGLAARESRSRAAATLAELKLERMRGHLSYRLGQAFVGHARPARWLGMPGALLKAWRAYRESRDAGGPVPKTLVLPVELDTAHPSGHLSLTSAWQAVGVQGDATPQVVWLRALSLSLSADIDIEWALDEGPTQSRPMRFSVRAGQVFALAELGALARVRGGLRKVAGPPCILQLERRPVGQPLVPARESRAVVPETVATTQSQPGARPALQLPPVDSIVYRSVPYMERRQGGHRAASVVFDKTPLISVIMTTFNTEAFVEAAIESILAQTWRHLELIVVDDCSSDGTRERVARLAQRDKRVRLSCFGDNRGTYWCKNHGITLARGEVVTFMDSDDLSAPTRLAEQFAELNRAGRVMVTCNLVRQDECGQVLAINGQTERIAPISKMVKREVIREIGYFDSIRTSADDEFMQRVKLAYGRSAHHNIAKVLYTALVRKDSLTSDPENAINLAAASNGQAYLSAPRKHYADSYAGWHRSLTARGMVPYMPFPVVTRPFPVYGKLVVKDGRYDGNRISVCLASFPPRREQLRRTVQSVVDHVDAVYIYLNGYDAVPDFLEHPRIHVTLARDSRGDLRDNGKFMMAEQVPEGYCFTIDDDIDYPEDYFEALIRRIEFYDRRAVVGLHGTVFAKPFDSYFKGRTLYHFRDGLDHDRLVNQLGTGTVAFHTELVRPKLSWFARTGMADAYFAVEMKRRGIGLVALARPKAWLSPQPGVNDPGAGGTNLYEEFRNNDEVQTALMRTHAPFDEQPHGALAQLMEQRLTRLGRGWTDFAPSTRSARAAEHSASRVAVAA